MAAVIERVVPQSMLCPKYLHTNSTSHTWAFGAIAELIDNAYDPDVNAKQIWIDKTRINGQDCLTLMDNGNGLNCDKMHKMLSFGFSDKTAVGGVQPIGIYGNGFKSGAMRLGRDALVLSKSKDAMCVGMLSQTYLEKTQAQQINVPIVAFKQETPGKFCVREDQASLKDILSYSLFKIEEDLLKELDAINSTCATGSTGTRIIIWNLRRTSSGKSELDFTTDRYDIRIPDDEFDAQNPNLPETSKHLPSTPASKYSLRAYCSILYLKPRMQIIICGVKVKTQLISKSLAFIATDSYKPVESKKRISIKFGYNTKSKDQYGIMMYHKNRLIQAYKHVGCQDKGNYKGVGVVGVIECDFLNPTHNKQDFDNTESYRRTLLNLGTKLKEYWKEISFKRKRADKKNKIPVEDAVKHPDQNWAQCDDCLKWRRLPDDIDCKQLRDKWFCRMNPDPQFRSCQVPEELEDSDDDQPAYQKTYKIQEREDKLKEQQERIRLEEERKRQETERIRNETMQEVYKQHNIMTVVQSPSTPETGRSRFYLSKPQGGAAGAECSSFRSPILSQAACSTFSGSTTVTTDVSSLLTSTPSRGKRPLLNTPRRPVLLKRPRMIATHAGRDTSQAPLLEEVIPESSTSALVVVEDDYETEINDVPLSDIATQTEGVTVKEERERPEQSQHQGNGHEATMGYVEAGLSHLDPLDRSCGPSHEPTSKRDAQEELDNLRELVQSTAQERDSLKVQVQMLTGKLSQMELSLVMCESQGSQTEETGEWEDYKSLYEEAIKRAGELSGERDNLNQQVDRLVEEKTNLCNQFDEFKLVVEQQREEAERNLNSHLTENDPVVNGPEETGRPENSTASSADARTLVELRLNVARLLASKHIPQLDLNQVNFECTVIDELLDQLLSGDEFSGAVV